MNQANLDKWVRMANAADETMPCLGDREWQCMTTCPKKLKAAHREPYPAGVETHDQICTYLRQFARDHLTSKGYDWRTGERLPMVKGNPIDAWEDCALEAYGLLQCCGPYDGSWFVGRFAWIEKWKYLISNGCLDKAVVSSTSPLVHHDPIGTEGAESEATGLTAREKLERIAAGSCDINCDKCPIIEWARHRRCYNFNTAGILPECRAEARRQLDEMGKATAGPVRNYLWLVTLPGGSKVYLVSPVDQIKCRLLDGGTYRPATDAEALALVKKEEGE